MSIIELKLPDHLAEYVESRAKCQGFSSASELIIALISSTHERQKELENQLRAGLNSGPATPWDHRELMAIKDQILNRET